MKGLHYEAQEDHRKLTVLSSLLRIMVLGIGSVIRAYMEMFEFGGSILVESEQFPDVCSCKIFSYFHLKLYQ